MTAMLRVGSLQMKSKVFINWYKFNIILFGLTIGMHSNSPTGLTIGQVFPMRYRVKKHQEGGGVQDHIFS